MSGFELHLPIADHGDLVTVIPFFLPVLLIVGGIVALRALERRRNNQ